MLSFYLLPTFLNCFLSNLTVIFIISIGHMDKIRVEIANKFWHAGFGKGGGGGVRWSVISDTLGLGGGGYKRTNLYGRPSWMAL